MKMRIMRLHKIKNSTMRMNKTKRKNMTNNNYMNWLILRGGLESNINNNTCKI